MGKSGLRCQTTLNKHRLQRIWTLDTNQICLQSSIIWLFDWFGLQGKFKSGFFFFFFEELRSSDGQCEDA